MNYLMNGLAALAFIVLFSQCAGKTDNQTTSTPAQANAELSGMKIAYVGNIVTDIIAVDERRVAQYERRLFGRMEN